MWLCKTCTSGKTVDEIDSRLRSAISAGKTAKLVAMRGLLAPDNVDIIRVISQLWYEHLHADKLFKDYGILTRMHTGRWSEQVEADYKLCPDGRILTAVARESARIAQDELTRKAAEAKKSGDKETKLAPETPAEPDDKSAE